MNQNSQFSLPVHQYVKSQVCKFISVLHVQHQNETNIVKQSIHQAHKLP